jgi:hypothetical protein
MNRTRAAKRPLHATLLVDKAAFGLRLALPSVFVAATEDKVIFRPNPVMG